MYKFQDYRKLHKEIAKPATKLWAKSLLVGTQTKNQNQLRKWLQKRTDEVNWLSEEASYLKRRFHGVKIKNNEHVLLIEELQPNSSKILTHSFWQLLNVKEFKDIYEISYNSISDHERKKVLDLVSDLSSIKKPTLIYTLVNDYLDLLTHDLMTKVLFTRKYERHSGNAVIKQLVVLNIPKIIWGQRDLLIYFDILNEVQIAVTNLVKVLYEIEA